MNQLKFLNSPEISEMLENYSELHYLLDFFSQTQFEQWNHSPDEFPPCWVDLSHGNADTPILFLILIFSELIIANSSYYTYLGFSKKINTLLSIEIHGLIDSWMLSAIGNEHIFDKRPEDLIHEVDGIHGADRIWVVLSRLCKIATDYDDWSKYPIKELSFEYFVEKYATDYDPC